MSGNNEFADLARDFAESGIKVGAAVYEAFKASGDAFAEDWRSNARETSGVHGKYYPDSITSETLLALGVRVQTGPETGRKQGRMGRGFEFGSVNQRPHLDGARALPIADRRLDRLSDAAIGHALP